MEGKDSSFVVQDDNTRRFPGSAGRRQRCCWFVPSSLRWRNPVLVAAKVALLVVTVLVSANSNFEQRCGVDVGIDLDGRCRGGQVEVDVAVVRGPVL